jgi:hypothetical protein
MRALSRFIAAHLTRHILLADAADKPKREPTAYQVFCKEHMKKWNEDNPGRAKEAMTEVRPSSSCIHPSFCP